MDKKVTCRMIDGQKIEVLVDELSFRPSVYGVIIKDGKVLLVPQWDGYDFPGGGVDLGELVKDTLIREVKEETGLDITPGQIVHAEDDFFFHPHRHTPLQTPMLYFLCEVTEGELSTDGFSETEKEYAKKAEWVPLEAVSGLKFYNSIVDSPKLVRDALWLMEALNNKKS